MALHNGWMFSSTPPHGGTLNSTAAPHFLDDGASVIKLDKPVTIAVAVSSLVGLFIVLVSLFEHFLRPKSSPLLSKQPLTYYREMSRLPAITFLI